MTNTQPPITPEVRAWMDAEMMSVYWPIAARDLYERGIQQLALSIEFNTLCDPLVAQRLATNAILFGCYVQHERVRLSLENKL